MIDIENKVIDTVYKAVIAAFPPAQYPNLSFYSEPIDAPTSFPCVVIAEEDNYTYRQTQDGELNEHNAVVMYSVNVFSNKQDGHKAEAKKILATVDTAMQSMLFTRLMTSPIPNVDRTIYRIAARYTALVGRPVKDGNNNVSYQMNRTRG